MSPNKVFIAVCFAISLSYFVGAEKRSGDSSDTDGQKRISTRLDGRSNSDEDSNGILGQDRITSNNVEASGDSNSASHAQRHPTAVHAPEDGTAIDNGLSAWQSTFSDENAHDVDQHVSTAGSVPLGVSSDVPSVASAAEPPTSPEAGADAKLATTENAQVVPLSPWDDLAGEDGHGEHDALFCRVCGHQLFAAEDHLSDMRFPGRRDGLAAHAVGPVSALQVRYLHAPSLGINGTVHEIEALPVVRAPQHMMVDRSQRDSRSGTSLGAADAPSAAAGRSAAVASGAAGSAATPASPVASAKAASQSLSRWPVVDMAAFDVGSGITVGKPYAPSSLPPSGAAAGGAAAAVSEVLPGYAVRPVTCQQCGATVGHHFTRRSPAGKSSSSSSSSSSDGSSNAQAAHGRSAAAGAARAAAAADSAARRKAASRSAASSPTPFPAPSNVPSYASPPTQYRVRTYKEGEEDAALSVLEGRCLSFSTGGWWRFMMVRWWLCICLCLPFLACLAGCRSLQPAAAPPWLQRKHD